MKHFAIPLLAGLVACCTQAPAQKLEFKEHITKEFSISSAAVSTTLAVYNLNGSINVEGYSGDKVILEIDKTISAKEKEILEKGKIELKLNFDQTSDSIITYISEPYDTRPNRNYNWDKGEKHRKVEYTCHLEFKIKVPYALNLNVSTINDGDINISDVTGTLAVANINGAIKLANAKGTSKLTTINGNVEANYLVAPPGDSKFQTLNGDIKISYPATLAADCEFKTFNGAFYTDFPNTETLPVKVIKNNENKSEKTVYKLDTETRIRFGSGGKNYHFETFNGNIYIKKQS